MVCDLRYDGYQDDGYDVVAETAAFDAIWVGTESRDYYDNKWGGNPAYDSCIVYKFLCARLGHSNNIRLGFRTFGVWGPRAGIILRKS